MGNYYTDSNYLYTLTSVDLSMIQHFADMLFGGDQSRVIYSTNDYAFRKRSRENLDDSSLNFPFLNLKLKDIDEGKSRKWQITAYSKGVYIPEISAKMRYAPIMLQYEASVWYQRDYDNKYGYTQLTWDAYNKTVLKPTVVVGTETLEFFAGLNYTNLSLDPDYTENDWLKQNKIHNISLDFEVDTFNLITNTDITIPTELVVNFAMSHNIDTTDYDETLSLVIDQLNEEVIL